MVERARTVSEPGALTPNLRQVNSPGWTDLLDLTLMGPGRLA